VAKRELLGNEAAPGEARHVCGGDVERSHDRGRVVRHRLDRDRTFRHRRPTRPPVVERSDPIAVGESVELELPRLDGVTQATDQKDVRSLANLLGPDVELARPDVVAHR
jgi:hypothetical protein